MSIIMTIYAAAASVRTSAVVTRRDEKVRYALWGQGGKSLPLSEFSIFGHIWV